MKLSLVLAGIVVVLSALLIRTGGTVRQYQAVVQQQRLQLSSLKSEHDFYLMPRIGGPLDRPMLAGENAIHDSIADGIYVMAVSTCGPCQALQDSLSIAGVTATYVMEETRAMLADTEAGTRSQYPMVTGASGGLVDRLPNTGTPGIAVVSHGLVVEFHTGLVPVVELQRFAALAH